MIVILDVPYVQSEEKKKRGKKVYPMHFNRQIASEKEEKIHMIGNYVFLLFTLNLCSHMSSLTGYHLSVQKFFFWYQ